MNELYAYLVLLGIFIVIICGIWLEYLMIIYVCGTGFLWLYLVIHLFIGIGMIVFGYNK